MLNFAVGNKKLPYFEDMVKSTTNFKIFEIFNFDAFPSKKK